MILWGQQCIFIFPQGISCLIETILWWLQSRICLSFINYLHVRTGGAGRGDTPRFYITLCLLQREGLPCNHHPRDQPIKGNPPSQFPIKLLLRLLVVDVIAAPAWEAHKGLMN